MATTLEATVRNAIQSIVIDPKGDMSLLLNSTKILVSSKMMRLTSTVFDAMLNPLFKEGRDLQTKGHCTIKLKEDEKAMTTVCRALHHDPEQALKIPSLDELDTIAKIVDKYDCRRAISCPGTLWVREHLNNSVEDLFRLLRFAYLVDLPESFTAVSYQLVMRHPGTFQGQTVYANDPLITVNLIALLELRRLHLLQWLTKNAMNIAQKGDAEWHAGKHWCDSETQFQKPYLQALSSYAKAPFNGSLDKQSITALNRRLHEPPKLKHVRNSSYRGEDALKGACGCIKAIWDMGSKIRTQLRRFEDMAEGLCLDCTKTNGASKGNGSCKIPHELL